MKPVKHQAGLTGKAGQGMTEYIIIIAIVAVAAILIVALFGGQIKSAFTGMTQALAGKKADSTDYSGASKTADKTDDMGTFGDKAKAGGH